MAEAIFLSAIQKLENRRIGMPEFLKGEMGGVINELITMSDLVRDKNLDFDIVLEGSNYSIREAVEIAHDELALNELMDVFAFLKEIKFIRSLLREVKTCMLQLGVDDAMVVQPIQGIMVAEIEAEVEAGAETEAEAVFLRVIQEVDSWLVELPSSYEYMQGDMYNLKFELEMILESLVRDKKLGEGGRLNYFISDLIEMARDVLDLNKHKYSYLFYEEMNALRSRLDLAKSRVLQFGVEDSEPTESSMRPENTGDGDEEDVVGMEEDVRLLLRRAVFNEGRGLSTSFITGMVGIGKTALARQLYKHIAVVDRFELRAWVCASSELSNKDVLMKMVQQVVDSEELQRDSLMEKMESADNATLQQMIHQHLQGRPYFIVLDDVPKVIRLTSIMKALPLEEKGSRLLLTSRSQDIKATIHYTHVMKTLDSDKSWQLFFKTIFSGNKFTSEETFPKHLEKQGKEILAKCSGVPLAIKEIGSQMAKKRRSGSEWEEVFESIDFGATLKLLELSYQKLDPIVKSYFLHLAFFEENKAIRAEKLKQIWGAGGVLLESEVGEFIRNLVSESIIEVEEKSKYNKTKSYRVNAILHRLSIKKAEEEIGFQILRKDGDNQPSKSPRHRVISCSREKFDHSTDQDKDLISLFFHGGGYFDSSPSYWRNFELLWILDFEDFGLKVLPETIGTLMELKYLGLRNNYLQELPLSLSLSGLERLEVLDISLNFMVEVPDVIWKMSSLLHLYMSDVICRKPWKIDVSVQNPVTSTYISLDNWTYELSGMTRMAELRKLGIIEVDGNSDVSELFASLARIGYLQRLTLRGFRFRSLPCLDDLRVLHSLTDLKLYGLLATLPSVDSFPPFIYNLKLVDTVLGEDPMPVLEQLPYLKQLELRNAYTGRQMAVSKNGLIMLKVLCIKELWNLRDVRVGKGGMWQLEKFEIKNCPYLETLTEEIGSMSMLIDLEMVTTKKIATKIRRSGFISKIEEVEIIP